MKRVALIGLALLTVLIVISSCLSYRGLRVDCVGEKQCSFDGLRQALADSSPLHVIVVHGMGSPPEGFSKELTMKVAEELDLTLERTTAEKIRRTPQSRHEALLTISSFRTPQKIPVTFYEVLWAPLINSIKSRALEYDSKAPWTNERSTVNRVLKRELVNNRLADPVLYLGIQNEEIQYPIRFTVCRAGGGTIESERCKFPEETETDSSEIVVISHSLGSRVVFDTLLGMISDEGESERAQNFVDRTTKVFMFANQLPLLELAEATTDRDEASQGGFAGFLRARVPRGREEAAIEKLQIVAMSDPNDLLSYPMPDRYKAEFPMHDFVNVTIGVSGFGLRLAANPLAAHIGHADDKRVIRMLVDGSPK